MYHNIAGIEYLQLKDKIFVLRMPLNIIWSELRKIKPDIIEQLFHYVDNYVPAIDVLYKEENEAILQNYVDAAIMSDNIEMIESTDIYTSKRLTKFINSNRNNLKYIVKALLYLLNSDEKTGEKRYRDIFRSVNIDILYKILVTALEERDIEFVDKCMPLFNVWLLYDLSIEEIKEHACLFLHILYNSLDNVIIDGLRYIRKFEYPSADVTKEDILQIWLAKKILDQHYHIDVRMEEFMLISGEMKKLKLLLSTAQIKEDILRRCREEECIRELVLTFTI